jgi:hypothetical protein
MMQLSRSEKNALTTFCTRGKLRQNGLREVNAVLPIDHLCSWIDVQITHSMPTREWASDYGKNGDISGLRFDWRWLFQWSGSRSCGLSIPCPDRFRRRCSRNLFVPAALDGSLHLGDTEMFPTRHRISIQWKQNSESLIRKLIPTVLFRKPLGNITEDRAWWGESWTRLSLHSKSGTPVIVGYYLPPSAIILS